MDKFENIITDYRKQFNKTASNQNFREKKNLATAITNAIKSKGYSNHQRLVNNNALESFANELLKREIEISKVEDFPALIEIVKVGYTIWGIGELTVYDTSERIGLFLGIEPDAVYLHKGTMTGAKELFGTAFKSKVIARDGFSMIAKDSFPQEFQKCSCAEIEDILCMYKKDFKKSDSDFSQSLCNRKKESKRICYKQIKYTLIAICLLVTTVSFAQSGQCGSNLTWTLSGSGNNLTLTITGTGDMYDYNSTSDRPWNTGSTYITQVVMDDRITHIGDRAFSGCSSQSSLTIPSSTISIGYQAFMGWHNLTSIVIPNSVTSIGANTFSICSSATSITLGEGVETIGQSAFVGVPVNTINFNAINLLTHTGAWYAMSPPEAGITLNIGNNVQIIPDNAFIGMSLKGALNIPNSVKSIGSSAFNGCKKLTSITIAGSGITSIGNSAFNGCTGLTSVTIGNGVKNIGNSAFYNCSNLSSITIGNGVSSIENSAFYYCSSLISVTIPNSVTSIGNSAFRECSSLNSLIIGEGIASIETFAFAYCKKLTSIIIPNGIIGNGVFMNCSDLISITIGEGVTNIGGTTFMGCSSLTTINFNAINCIGSLPFSGTQPTTLNIGNKVQIINGNIFNNLPLKGELNIPNSVTSIGNSAFQQCSNLTSLIIGQNVTNIGTFAFGFCSSFTNIFNLSFIPQNISSDAYVFYDLTLSNHYCPTKILKLIKY